MDISVRNMLNHKDVSLKNKQDDEENYFTYLDEDIHIASHIEPLPIELLSKLREKYNFTPPQSYAYFEKYPELTKLIFNEKNIVLK